MTRTFGHDAEGNLTRADGMVRLTGAAGYEIHPRRVLPGQRVNLYGRGFPHTSPGDLVVRVGGVAAQVESVSRRLVTFIVPTSVTSGGLEFQVGSAPPVNFGAISLVGIAITPASVPMRIGQTASFTATLFGGLTGPVEWAVEGIVGGNATVGTIDANGLYTAPAPASARDFPFRITARDPATGLISYAQAISECTSTRAMPDETLIAGATTVPYSRECHTFSASRGEVVYVAMQSAAPIRGLSLRSASDEVLGRAAGGSDLRLPHVVIPVTGTYRILVEGGATASTAFSLWMDIETVARPKGRWMSPFPGSFAEPANWAQGVVPESSDSVVIPEVQPGLVVTVGTGRHEVAGLQSDAALRLEGGELACQGSFDVDGALVLAGGIMEAATVISRSGAPPVQVAASTASELRDVTLLRELEIDLRADLRLTGSTTLGRAVTFLRRDARLFFAPGQQIDVPITSTIGATGFNRIQLTAPGQMTLGPSGELRGGFLLIGGANSGGQAMDLVNEGLIVSEVPGRRVEFQVASLDNRGTLRGNGGDLDIGVTGSFLSRGSIEALAGSDVDAPNLQLSSGSLIVSGGSSMSVAGLTGTLGGVTLTDAGSSLSLGGSFAIGSALSIDAGTSLSLSGTQTGGAGLLNLNGGTLSFSGDAAPLGSVQLSGGSVLLTGTLENAGSSLDLRGGVSWTMSNCTVNGGAITTAAGVPLRVLAGPSNLADVAVQVAVEMERNAILRVRGSSTLAAPVTFLERDARLFFEPGHQIDVPITSTIGATGFNRIQLEAPGLLTVGPSGELRGGFLLIGGANSGGQAMDLVSEGLIVSEVPGRRVEFQVASLDNRGTLRGNGGDLDIGVTGSFLSSGSIEALAGSDVDAPNLQLSSGSLIVSGGSSMSVAGLTGTLGGVTLADAGSSLSLGGSFAFGGALSIDAGTSLSLSGTLTGGAGLLNLNGGTLSFSGDAAPLGSVQLSGGSVLLTGTLENAGSSLDLRGGVQWTMVDCTLNGGAITSTSGVPLRVLAGASNLADVAVQVAVEMERNATLRVRGSSTLAAPVAFLERDARLFFEPGHQIDVPITSTTGATGFNRIQLEAPGLLTVGPSGELRGGFLLIGGANSGGQAMDLVNEGLIVSEVPGRRVEFQVASLDNRGTLRGNGGDLDIGVTGSFFSSGSIEALAGSDVDAPNLQLSSGSLIVSGGSSMSVAGLTGTLGGVTLADAGSSLSLSGSFALGGALSIDAGTSLSLSGTLTGGAGLLNLNGGTLSFSGDAAPLGSVQLSGGSVLLTGTLENAGSSLDLRGGVQWTMVDCTLNGGAITSASGVPLRVLAGASNLADVAVQVAVEMERNATLRVRGSSTLAAPVAFLERDARLFFEPGHQIDVPITSTTGATGFNRIQLEAPGLLTVGPSGELRGGFLLIGGANSGGQAMDLVNEGLIVSEVPGRRVEFQVASLDNRGTLRGNGGDLDIGVTGSFFSSGSIEALAGSSVDAPNLQLSSGSLIVSGGSSMSVAGLTGTLGGVTLADAGSSLSLSGSFALGGALSIDAGTSLSLSGTLTGGAGLLNLNGGTLAFSGDAAPLGSVQLSGGSVLLTGTLENAGSSLDLRGGVQWTMVDCTLNGGAITSASGVPLRVLAGASNLADVAVQVAIEMERNAILRVRGSSTLSAPVTFLERDARLFFEPGHQIDVPISSTIAATAFNYVQLEAPGQLTVGPTGEMRGGFLSIGQASRGGQPMDLVNQGLIVSEVAGRRVQIDAGSFVNAGTVRVVSGEIEVRSALSGSGGFEVTAGATLQCLQGVALTGATVALDGLLDATGSVSLLGGELSGSGQLQGNLSTSGTLRPGGAGAGLLAITGNLDLLTGARLEMELGGLMPGTEHDQISVSGSVALGGTLALSTTGTYQPVIGDSYLILSSPGAPAGAFSGVTGVGLPGGLTAQVNSGASGVTVVAQ